MTKLLLIAGVSLMLVGCDKPVHSLSPYEESQAEIQKAQLKAQQDNQNKFFELENKVIDVCVKAGGVPQITPSNGGPSITCSKGMK